MKKRLIPLLLLILALSLLCGCTAYEAPTGRVKMYTVDPRGGDWVIDYDAKTISSGAGSYAYTVENAGTADPTVTILLPNGVTYYENNHSSGYTGDYGGNKHAFGGGLGQNLMELIRPSYMPRTRKPDVIMVIISALCILRGVVSVADPEFVWMMDHLFRSHLYQNVEPSDEGLRRTRIIGVVLILIGIFVFFMKWS